MDANKLVVLREIRYRIVEVCGRCEHSEIAPGADWGTCRRFTYRHEKHAGAERDLSVHRMGVCPVFEPRSGALHLGGFDEFVAR